MNLEAILYKPIEDRASLGAARLRDKAFIHNDLDLEAEVKPQCRLILIEVLFEREHGGKGMSTSPLRDPAADSWRHLAGPRPSSEHFRTMVRLFLEFLTVGAMKLDRTLEVLFFLCVFSGFGSNYVSCRRISAPGPLEAQA